MAEWLYPLRGTLSVGRCGDRGVLVAESHLPVSDFDRNPCLTSIFDKSYEQVFALE